MKTTSKLLIVAAMMLTSVPPAFAQDMKKTAVADAAVSQGEVKKVDKETGKITIKHGELKNINMGPMTMVFDAADKASLAPIKPGDMITFVADNSSGQLLVRDVKVKK